MNNIIAASRLAEIIAERAGVPTDTAAAFIREYFSQAFNIISSGQDLHLKDLGSFRLTGNADAPLEFVTDPSLAAKVNAPFDAFTPITLEADDSIAAYASTPAAPEAVSPETAEVADTPAASETDSPSALAATPIPEPVPEPEPAPEPEPQPARQPQSEPEIVFESEAPQTHEPPLTPEPRPAPQYIACPVRDNSPGRGMQAFWYILAFALGIILGFGAGYYFHGSLDINIHRITGDVDYPEDNTAPEISAQQPQDTPAVSAEVTSSDSSGKTAATPTPPAATAKPADRPAKQPTAAPATQPAPEKAEKTAVKATGTKATGTYDTITSSTFLTSLARRHYGQMEYWVYIYEANPGLGNPNRIKPGTRVFIPDKSALPLTGKPGADIRNAKRKSEQIYSRYK